MAKSQDDESAATLPPARDAFGRLLDEWGLPVNGPCRVAALAALDLPDPLDDPKPWRKKSAPEPLPFATDIDVGEDVVDPPKTEPLKGAKAPTTLATEPNAPRHTDQGGF